MKYKATKKFQELGIEDSYQGLKTEDYFALRNGQAIELVDPSEHLLNGYIEVVKEKIKEK